MRAGGPRAAALLLGLALGACAPACSAATPSEPGRQALAHVGDVAITRAQLSQTVARRRLEHDGAGGVPAETQAALCAQALEDLIDRQLLVRAARRHHLAVFVSEVDAAWRLLAHNWEPQALAETLAAQGASPLAIKDDLREALLAQKYLRTMVLDRVAVLDHDIEAYLADHPEVQALPEQVRLRQIVLPDEATAARVAEQIRRGQSFAEAAMQHSRGQEAAQGGELGYVSRQVLPSDVAARVFALPLHRVSAPIVAIDGVHLFWVSERLPKRHLPLALARPQAEATLRDAGERAAARAHLALLRQQIPITREDIAPDALL